MYFRDAPPSDGRALESIGSVPNGPRANRGAEPTPWDTISPMAMDLRVSFQKVEILTLIVQLGGVGRAAEHLMIAQPVVSAHLRTLESRLGAQLFYREGRQLHLTEAGVVAYEWAEDLLMRLREFERDLDGLLGGSKGQIAFGSSMSLGSYRMPAILADFRARFPGVDARLSIAESEHVIQEARKGALDFGVVATDPDIDIPGMIVEQLGEDEIVLVTAPGDLPGMISLDEFKALSFVEPVSEVRRGFIDRQLHRLGVVDRKVVLELGHPEAMKRAVRAGIGSALLFRSAVSVELAANRLQEVRIEGVELVAPITLVYSRRKSISKIHSDLIDAIRTAVTRSGSPVPT